MIFDSEKALKWLQSHCEKVSVSLKNDTDTKTVHGWFYPGIAPHRFAAGYYHYSVRHADEDEAVPKTVERVVVVNRYGDIFFQEVVENMSEIIEFKLE